MSYKLYPKVFADYASHFDTFGEVYKLPTRAFFYGLQANEEILVRIDVGKTILIKYLNKTEPTEQGKRLVFFSLNGQTRSVEVQDLSVKTTVRVNRKVERDTEIGAPLQGSLSKILVKEGDIIELNDPLFVIEAMKMESTITAPHAGTVSKIFLSEKTMVEQDDVILDIS